MKKNPKMTPLILDFETYFDKDLTLKKLNYTEYVAKTHVICVSTLHNHQLICTHNAEEHLTQFDWPNILLVGHNLLFDALVLKHHFGIEAGAYMDTLGMARLLYPTRDHDLGSLRDRFLPQNAIKDHSALTSTKGKTWDALSPEEQTNLIAYCKNDTLITAQLYELWKDQIPDQEAQIMDHTIKLWLNPVLILDAEKALIAIQEEQDEVKRLLQKHKLAKETIRSDQQFYNFLETKGVTPPTQFSKKQQKHIPAFSKTNPAFQQFYHEHPELHELLDLKRTVNSNIKESRTLGLIRAAKLNNGRIPVAYNYCGAFTGRFCLTGDTMITVLRGDVILDILIPELLPDDLVWDGENFVTHGGLVYQGIHEVMSYDGITGTPDHRVYVEEISGEVELREAYQRGYKIKIASPAPRIRPDLHHPRV